MALVRSRGLEPPRLAALTPQASASTNSATTARGRGIGRTSSKLEGREQAAPDRGLAPPPRTPPPNRPGWPSRDHPMEPAKWAGKAAAARFSQRILRATRPAGADAIGANPATLWRRDPEEAHLVGLHGGLTGRGGSPRRQASEQALCPTEGQSSSIPPRQNGRAGTWVGSAKGVALLAGQRGRPARGLPIGGGWSNGHRVAILSHSGASAPSSHTGSPAHEIAIVSTRRVERYARPRRIRGGLRLDGRARRCHRGW